jgi:hypothetical protein
MKKTVVRGSRTGRPVMALLDLMGRRWTLRIVWELREERALTSRALRTACDEASPTIVQARLSELREAGFVELMRATATGSRRWAGSCRRRLRRLQSLCGAVGRSGGERRDAALPFSPCGRRCDAHR